MINLTLYLSLQVFCSSIAGTGSAMPRELPAPEVLEQMKIVRSYTELGLSPEFIVSGEKVIEGQILAANVLVFMPGSRLIFLGGSGDRTERYVVARTVRVLPGEPAPTITWARSLTFNRQPEPMGKAAPGAAGGGEGFNGAQGTAGQTGNPGYPGRNAPGIYFFMNKLIGGPITIDLRGEDGGPGGEGQTGGDGGVGRSGQPAVSSILDCRSGGGSGGNGGQGGRGGNGGEGGRGGNGGTFVLLSIRPELAKLVVKNSFNVDVSPGKGGPPGEEGQGGKAGPPGEGGRGGGFCSGGNSGAPGLDGPPGSSGQPGKDGVHGIFAISELTPYQLNLALGKE